MDGQRATRGTCHWTRRYAWSKLRPSKAMEAGTGSSRLATTRPGPNKQAGLTRDVGWM